MSTPKPEKCVIRDMDRHGNIRWYYRRKGCPKVRLRQPYGSKEFYEELSYARLGLDFETGKPLIELRNKPEKGALKGTFRWLVEQYLQRAVKNLAPATRTQKRRVLDAVCMETCLSRTGQPLADMPFTGLQKQHIAILRDQKAQTPEAANHRLKALSTMFNWAVEVGLADKNPVERVKKFRTKSNGIHTLTEQEIDTYLQKHPGGTKAYLAMQIFRYTGLRISDVARLGKQHLYTTKTEDGPQLRFKIRPQKTSKLQAQPVEVDMPVLPPLAEALARIDHDHLTFLVTHTGKSYSVKGLGNRMRSWFDTAGLPHCSAHGIRKAGAVIAAENGATANQLMSMFGWTKLDQAELYTKKAQRKALGDKGSKHLAGKS
ncbi:tyrosine-type recombinase/integrase [Pseudovibrio sp. Alg231-02]|uniref:tyrosine-type recombinase/integrase n=1 Tax=Pseudovibrio sp. Alg231-02 TaxID=1922223 RepID=UPI00131F348F|nr:site-specific integrase [Pseudovibrio sp. Alg231-02]